MSVDHLCIAWCKQVVKAVVRSLFDMVTISPSNSKLQWIDNPELRKEILNYHLIEVKCILNIVSALLTIIFFFKFRNMEGRAGMMEFRTKIWSISIRMVDGEKLLLHDLLLKWTKTKRIVPILTSWSLYWTMLTVQRLPQWLPASPSDIGFSAVWPDPGKIASAFGSLFKIYIYRFNPESYFTV